jgi:hypothetical protein
MKSQKTALNKNLKVLFLAISYGSSQGTIFLDSPNWSDLL